MTAAGERILNLDGIASDRPRDDGQPYYHQAFDGSWLPSSDDRLEDVCSACRRLDWAMQGSIMAGVDQVASMGAMPVFVMNGGLSSESTLSRDDFKLVLSLPVEVPERNRLLYLFDCQRLVGSVSHCVQEVHRILAEFYRLLNEPNLTGGPPLSRDGVVFSLSPTVTQIFANLSFIFMRLHSLLDYCVKLAIEVARPQTDFATYARMASRGRQYGDRKRVAWNGAAGTLFEDCDFTRSIEALRNHVVHDGLLDEQPKVYEEYRDGALVRRFVLFPDMTGGRLDHHVNRNLFYGREDRINLRLPTVFLEFQERLIRTLELIEADVGAKARGR